jgi:hypothetical protein
MHRVSGGVVKHAQAGHGLQQCRAGELRSVGPLAAVMVAVGVALGAVDVSAPAFASQHGQPGLAGVLIAACSVGSLLGGLACGARSCNSPATTGCSPARPPSCRCGGLIRCITSSRNPTAPTRPSTTGGAIEYEVAADDLGVRPKIRDIGWHRLRANVAALVDWLRICCREGWLGKPRRNHLGTERKFRDRASKIVEKLAKMRVRMGIMGAYGEKAEQLVLGKRTPPSRRDRGAPAA